MRLCDLPQASFEWIRLMWMMNFATSTSISGTCFCFLHPRQSMNSCKWKIDAASVDTITDRESAEECIDDHSGRRQDQTLFVAVLMQREEIPVEESTSVRQRSGSSGREHRREMRPSSTQCFLVRQYSGDEDRNNSVMFLKAQLLHCHSVRSDSHFIAACVLTIRGKTRVGEHHFLG